MGGRALIIEDDEAIADLIALFMGKSGIEAVSVRSAEEGRDAMSGFRPDLVILDLNLPGMDGMLFLEELRRSDPVPVIIVSARETDEDKILGLGLGADDFVTKPFSPRVLAARARAQLRRSGLETARKPRIRFGPFSLDLDGKLLEKNGVRLSVSPKEFEILAFLAGRPGAAFRPDELYRAVWGSDYGDVSTVAVHIQRLRRKIEEDPTDPRWIITDHGFGYRFNPKGGGE